MLQIRKYVSSDQPALIELLRLNTPEYFSPDEKGDFITYLDSEIEDYFIASIDDQIVGCGGINYKEEDSIGIISWDIVSKSHHGKGIGSELLSHRLSCIKNKLNISKIIVRTSQHVFPFYEKHGFTLIKTVKDYWEKGYDLYHMEMDLAKQQ